MDQIVLSTLSLMHYAKKFVDLTGFFEVAKRNLRRFNRPGIVGDNPECF
jgi:hypothetical protein